ncbi:MAG: S41 family peptidase [Chloroflexi bacterium]|nr:S41 family peptidase [Chloroflexota bacterium]
MNKTLRYILIGLLAFVLLTGAFSGGFVAGHYWPAASEQAPSDLAPTPLPQAETATPDELQTLFAPFWQSWQIVHDQYVDQPVDDTKLMEGAIRGMLESLGDQHTSYMDPDQYLQANMDIEGEYNGIGAWVDSTGEYLTIVSPMPDSPAEQAGLKPGDQIIAVDGEDMTGIAGELVIRRVLGPAGSTVHLTVRREGADEPLEFDVIRAHITVPSVDGKMLDDNIGYVHIYTFGANTTSELRSTLEDLLAQNPQGLIIDLRNNGGGFLQTAIEVGSEFIPKGKVILYEQYGDGSRDTHKAIPGGLATEIPLVVLINEGTASASEVVAGAIQDYGRGQLVGVTSFGKGSVQNWIELSDNQGAVRVTIAKWLTPNERTIHKIGLDPDVVVEMTKEDYEAERDPQLDKAVEVLSGMIGN